MRTDSWIRRKKKHSAAPAGLRCVLFCAVFFFPSGPAVSSHLSDRKRKKFDQMEWSQLERIFDLKVSTSFLVSPVVFQKDCSLGACENVNYSCLLYDLNLTNTKKKQHSTHRRIGRIAKSRRWSTNFALSHPIVSKVSSSASVHHLRNSMLTNQNGWLKSRKKKKKNTLVKLILFSDV